MSKTVQLTTGLMPSLKTSLMAPLKTTGVMVLLTAGLLAGPVAAQSADVAGSTGHAASADTTAPQQNHRNTVRRERGERHARTVASRTHSHRYRSRVTRPVATPEQGELFSTGQVGNHSAVPLPEDFRYEDTRPWRRFHEIPVGDTDRQRRVRTPAQNERRVTPLKDNVRKVRPFD